MPINIPNTFCYEVEVSGLSKGQAINDFDSVGNIEAISGTSCGTDTGFVSKYTTDMTHAFSMMDISGQNICGKLINSVQSQSDFIGFNPNGVGLDEVAGNAFLNINSNTPEARLSTWYNQKDDSALVGCQNLAYSTCPALKTDTYGWQSRLLFDGTGDFYNVFAVSPTLERPITIFFVLQNLDNTVTGPLLTSSTLSTAIEPSDTFEFDMGTSRTATASDFSSSTVLISAVLNGNQSVIFRNTDANPLSNNVSPGVTAPGALLKLANFGTDFFNGFINEMIVWNNDVRFNYDFEELRQDVCSRWLIS